MGNSVILYGYILAPAAFAQGNADAIHALPRDDVWPALTCDMFAVPAGSPEAEQDCNSLLITFGLVYQDLFSRTSDWALWCTKFEALLQSLRWDEAMVRLDVEAHGLYRCAWRADPPTNTTARDRGLVATWTRRGPEPVRD